MYCEFYGFKEKPFTVTPNPRFVFFSKNHKEAFAHLLYGIENHSGFILLTGEVGTGKTTVLRTILDQFDRSTVRSALILNPCLSSLELLRNINREFGIAWNGLSQQELLDALNLFLLAENRAGHTVALVIDEAQNLEPQVMEQIRMISNLETEKDKLIQIVLTGQPELSDILVKPGLRQFSQRIAVRFHLSAMDFEDTCAYIEHRLEVAGGWRSARFTKGAKRKIFRYSRGIPRIINILCDRALLIGYIDETREITGNIVGRAVSEIEEKGNYSRLLRFALGTCLLAVVVTCGLICVVVRGGSSPERFPIPPRPVFSVASSATIDGVNTSESVAALRNALSKMGETESAVAGFNALAGIWDVPPLGLNPNASLPRDIERIGEGRGLYLTGLKGTFERVLEIDSPALMEIRLPSGERRFLALVGRADGRFVVSPALGGRNSLDRSTLEALWSGKAYFPWRNFRNIPRLNPGMRGEAVAKLQLMLKEAGVFKGAQNGVYDRETTASVVSFQAAHGIAKNGRPGKQTLFFLYRNGNSFPFPRLDMKGGGVPG
jgi:general secretion pathway protein A